jgi:cytochrome c
VTEGMAMAEYMLSVNDKRLSSLPLQGTFTPAFPQGDPGRGAVVIRAIYSDKGAGEFPSLTSESMAVLRSPRLGPQQADVRQGVTPGPTRGAAGAIIPNANGHIGFKGLDLTGVTRVEIAAQAVTRNGQIGGTIEVRLGSPAGVLIGQQSVGLGGAAGPTATEIQAAGGRGGGRGGAAGPVAIPLKPTAGVHDVYFVFRNPKATATQPLMTVSTITVEQG